MKENYIFSIVTATTVTFYSTCSFAPLYFLNNIHLASLSCFVWSKNLFFAVGSYDGYITFGWVYIEKREVESSFES